MGCVLARDSRANERDLLVAIKEGVWLEDYAAARGAIKKLREGTSPQRWAFYARFVKPFEFASAQSPEQWSEGIRVLRQRVATPPPAGAIDPAARIYLAMILIRAEREDEGLAVLEQAPEYEQESLWMYRVEKAHLLARLYAERRQWNRAVGVLHDALPLLPHVESATHYFDNPPAICRVFRMRVEQVHDMYLREVDPARWLYKHHVLAVRSGDRKQEAQIKQRYQELLEQHPRSYWTGRAIFEHGLQIWEDGKEAEAARLWQMMVENDPEGPWRGHALLALGDYRLVVQLDFEAALALYRQAWKTLDTKDLNGKSPDQTWNAVGPQILGRLAATLRLSGSNSTDLREMPSQPLAEPEELSRLPATKEVATLLAAQHQWIEPASKLLADRAEGFAPRLTSDKAQFPPALLEKLSRAHKNPPTPVGGIVADHGAASLLVALGDVALQMGQADQAHALFQRVWKGTGVKVHSTQEEYAGRRLGDALLAQGKHPDALAHLTHLARKRVRSDRPVLLLSLARLQVGPTGRPADAFVTLKELLADYAASAECLEARYLLGKVLLAERQWDQAIAAFDELQASHPAHPWTREVSEVLLPLARNKGVRKLTDMPSPVPLLPSTPNPPTKEPEAKPGKKNGQPPKFTPLKA